VWSNPKQPSCWRTVGQAEMCPVYTHQPLNHTPPVHSTTLSSVNHNQPVHGTTLSSVNHAPPVHSTTLSRSIKEVNNVWSNPVQPSRQRMADQAEMCSVDSHQPMNHTPPIHSTRNSSIILTGDSPKKKTIGFDSMSDMIRFNTICRGQANELCLNLHWQWL